MFNSSGREWEKFGKKDPYYGVLTHEKFRTANLTDKNKDEFFRSGAEYIDQVLATIRQRIDPAFVIGKGLDFGCGVGRLVIPLAAVAQEVTGVDVSDSMLAEVRKNCAERAVKNVFFVKSDDNLSLLNGTYNFIHSYIVFQHIPVARGERIFKSLLEHLEAGGVCVAHFTYARNYTSNRWAPLVKKYIPLSSNVINLIKGRKFFAPQMEVNTYDLNRLFWAIQKANVSECHTEFTNHGDELGLVIYVKKPVP